MAEDKPKAATATATAPVAPVYLVQLKCKLREGVKEKFIENWLGANGAKVAREFPGNLGVFLAWSKTDPNSIIIQQRWRSPADSAGYVKLRSEGNGAEWREKFFAEGPDVSGYFIDGRM